ncbi:MAG TPA: hypothetical protein VK655_10155, partial [Solirubrobacteraceae bacterium]|nr:hypothetical protein [Solirubrobacteraceae bacterium]
MSAQARTAPGVHGGTSAVARHGAGAHGALTHAALTHAAIHHAAILHPAPVQIAPPQVSFAQEVQNFALNWEPVIAILFFTALIFMMWRMLKVMPRIKPQRIKPTSDQSVTFADIAGVDEAKAELAEIVEFLR